MNKEYAKAVAEKNGKHWFDASAMRFFNSRVLDSSWTKMGDDTYRFISSERYDDASPRLYTVREFTVSTGDVETIGEFQQYGTAGTAYRHIRD